MNKRNIITEVKTPQSTQTKESILSALQFKYKYNKLQFKKLVEQKKIKTILNEFYKLLEDYHPNKSLDEFIIELYNDTEKKVFKAFIDLALENRKILSDYNYYIFNFLSKYPHVYPDLKYKIVQLVDEKKLDLHECDNKNTYLITQIIDMVGKTDGISININKWVENGTLNFQYNGTFGAIVSKSRCIKNIQELVLHWISSDKLNLEYWNDHDYKYNLDYVLDVFDKDKNMFFLNERATKGKLNIERSFKNILKNKDKIGEFDKLVKFWIDNKKLDPFGSNREELFKLSNLFNMKSILDKKVKNDDINLNLGENVLIQKYVPYTKDKNGNFSPNFEIIDEHNSELYDLSSRSFTYNNESTQNNLIFMKAHLHSKNFFKHISNNADKIKDIDILLNDWIEKGHLDLKKAQNFEHFCKNANKIKNSTSLISDRYEKGYLDKNEEVEKGIATLKNKIKNEDENNSIEHPINTVDGYTLSDDSSVDWLDFVKNLEKFDDEKVFHVLKNIVNNGEFDIHKGFDKFYSNKCLRSNTDKVGALINEWVNENLLNLNDIQDEKINMNTNYRLGWAYKTESIKGNVILWINNNKLELTNSVIETICENDKELAKILIATRKIELNNNLVQKIFASLNHPSYINYKVKEDNFNGFKNFREFLDYSIKAGLELEKIFGVNTNIIKQHGKDKIIPHIVTYHEQLGEASRATLGNNNERDKIKSDRGLANINDFILNQIKKEQEKINELSNEIV